MKKYSLLSFIVITSVAITLVVTFDIIEPIQQYFIPPYNDCYQLLQNINNVDKKISKIAIFYIIFIIIYFILFSFILFKLLSHNQMKNIYTTIIILVLFNAPIIIFTTIQTFKLKESSIFWCDKVQKKSCQFSYKAINNLENNDSFTPTMKEIKPCLLDYENYSQRAIEVLKNKVNN